MERTPVLESCKPTGLRNQLGSHRSLTPVSMTSSSSEEDSVGISPFRSYDIISSSPPNTKAHGTDKRSVSIPKIDASILGDLELQSACAAHSLNEMTKEFAMDLKAISERTVEFTQLHQNCIREVHSGLDANVKTMYSLIAKAEELNQKMAPLYDLGHQIQDIKMMLDTLETMCN